MWLPTPATAGLNEPDALTPVPLHVPPGVAGVSVIDGSVTHRFCGIQIEASQQVLAIGIHAEAANVCTPPDLEASLDVPVPPHAIISPPELTSTS